MLQFKYHSYDTWLVPCSFSMYLYQYYYVQYILWYQNLFFSKQQGYFLSTRTNNIQEISTWCTLSSANISIWGVVRTSIILQKHKHGIIHYYKFKLNKPPYCCWFVGYTWLPKPLTLDITTAKVTTKWSQVTPTSFMHNWLLKYKVIMFFLHFPLFIHCRLSWSV